MTDEERAAQGAEDSKLLSLVRAGDTAAFGVLRQRHEQAARRLAGDLAGSAAEVDGVVAQAFARLLELTLRGGGPTEAFRPYLLAEVRRVCYETGPEGQPARAGDEQYVPDPGELFTDAAGVRPGMPLIVAAFLSLPERWIAILWHTEIEEASQAEVALLLGLTRSGGTALRRRAKDGLRQAYLQMHTSRVSREECRPVAERLGAFVRDAVPGRDSAMVTEHLSQCDDCRAVYSELADVSQALRDVVAPVFLGTAAASYLSGAQGSAAAATTAPATPRGQLADAGATAPAAAWGIPPQLARRPWQPLRWLAAAGVIAVCAAAFAFSLTGHGAAQKLTMQQQADPYPAPQPTGIVVQSPAPSPSKAPSVIPASPARGRHSATAAPPASAAPPADEPAVSVSRVRLAATVNVYGSQGRWHGAQVTFQVSDNGSAATRRLTVSISLPAGSWMFGWPQQHGHGHGPGGWPGGGGAGGWSCQPTSTGASCQHGAISAGSQSQGAIFIGVAGSPACGEPVEVAATSGSASASAQSPQDIQC